jgi:hypothetical protein
MDATPKGRSDTLMVVLDSGGRGLNTEPHATDGGAFAYRSRASRSCVGQ